MPSDVRRSVQLIWSLARAVGMECLQAQLTFAQVRARTMLILVMRPQMLDIAGRLSQCGVDG